MGLVQAYFESQDSSKAELPVLSVLPVLLPGEYRTLYKLVHFSRMHFIVPHMGTM